jgi:hypothetical protein
MRWILKKSIEKTYGRKGSKIVGMNQMLWTRDYTMVKVDVLRLGLMRRSTAAVKEDRILSKKFTNRSPL